MASNPQFLEPMMYPAAPVSFQGAIKMSFHQHTDIVKMNAPILVVGGRPVGMLQALTLARLHNLDCMLVERERTTTN